jgi:hypothetical protein
MLCHRLCLTMLCALGSDAIDRPHASTLRQYDRHGAEAEQINGAGAAAAQITGATAGAAAKHQRDNGRRSRADKSGSRTQPTGTTVEAEQRPALVVKAQMTA